MNTKDLRQQRVKLVEDARAITSKAITEQRALSAEERVQVERMEADIDSLKATIDAAERLSTEQREATPQAESRMAAFTKFAVHGMGALNQEERSLLGEQRAQSVGTTTAGGHSVPNEMMRQIEIATKQFGGMRESGAELITTDTGATLPIPTTNDTSNVAEIVSENTALTEQDVTFGQVSLGAYMYTSKIVRVSYQLLQDSATDIPALLSRLFAERMFRGTNAHFTTGTGTAQPQGIATGAVNGATGATGSTTSVTYAKLVELEHSVDPTYRRNGAKFMFHDTTLRAIKQLVDSQNRPLWAPGIAVGEPDRILGYPYVINQDVAQMAVNARSILFGDFSAYKIRTVRDMSLVRLNERYADFLQVGFLLFARYDGKLVDAGTNPVKYYQNSAT